MTFPAPSGGIIIIGGGVAGVSTAIAVKQNAPHLTVCVVDAPTPSGPAVGETLAPPARAALQTLGMSSLADGHLKADGSISLWGSDTPGHQDSWTELNGSALLLDRERFNLAVRDMLSKHDIPLLSDTRLIDVKTEKDWQTVSTITLKGPEGTQTLSPDFCIDATGYRSALARRLNIYRNTVDQLLTLSLFMPKPEGLRRRLLLEAVEDGWWYAAPLPGERAVVSFTSEKDIMEQQSLMTEDGLMKAFRKTAWIKTAVGPTLPSPTHMVVKAASSAILSAVKGHNWLAVGDSACSFDPITGSGIAKALMHGKTAGDAVAASRGTGTSKALDTYQEAVFADFSHYLTVRHALYLQERRFPTRPFWINRWKI